ncbi:MAG: putative transport system permease protein [Thermoplasmata archaeon]|jgi:putative ABC transport system permease protein|nr:putative transport system permease protein [Thermoplasmata archaeon]
MRAGDAARMAFGGLRERKTRTALTLLGILVGSAMLVALEASSQGQTQAIRSQLEKLGPTTLLVRPDNGQTFTDATLATVQALPHVGEAFLSVTASGTATGAGGSAGVQIMGVEPADAAKLVKGLVIASGDAYEDGSLVNVVVGHSVSAPTGAATDLVDAGGALQVASVAGRGRDAVTTTHSYTVVGVAAPFGSAPFIDVDNTVFMSPRAAQQVAKLAATKYNQVIVFADDAANVAAVQTELQGALGNSTRILSGTTIASTVTSVFSSIANLLTAVAAISLFVAGVGIANTMFVSVLERTTEIGTLKALGFKAREVLSVFLLEAAMTGLAGGVLGVLAGVGLAFGVQSFLPGSGGSRATAAPTATRAPAGGFGAPGGGGFRAGGGGGGFGGGGLPTTAGPIFTPELIFLVLAFAVGIAVLAGLIPARKASRLDPVIALKRL